MDDATLIKLLIGVIGAMATAIVTQWQMNRSLLREQIEREREIARRERERREELEQALRSSRGIRSPEHAD